ncbi:MAG: hypothetical protein ACR2PX_13175 [Endozoicomonas sp.]|uniref:hypothetical protein n=1 Tax=Endozoicomonas sp. TaxID=1892382 RepID=UPI003D9BDAD8
MAFFFRVLMIFLLPGLAMAESLPETPDLEEMTELANTLHLEQFQIQALMVSLSRRSLFVDQILVSGGWLR